MGIRSYFCQHLLMLNHISFRRNKAVADGAISFYLDHFVATRVAKYTYGTSCASAYNHFNLEHRKRSHKVTRSISGDKCLPCAFSSILKKVTDLFKEASFKGLTFQGARVSATQEFSTAMKFEMSQYSSQLSSEISCYKGILENPKWTDTEPGKPAQRQSCSCYSKS